MFGKPRQVKKLEIDLMATRYGFQLWDKMPDHNRAEFMRNTPADLEQHVRKAVNAGHGAAARDLVQGAAATVPPGATPEQWQQVLAPAMAVLG